MARRFDQFYRMKDGLTKLGAAFFNPIFQDLDLRVGGLEEIEKDWVEAVDAVTERGLLRIDEVLLPAFEKAQLLSELGFLSAQADPELGLTFALGEQGVLIAAGPQRDLFSPSPFIALTREGDIGDYALAERVSYDAATGLLNVNIIAVSGDPGPFTDVWVSAVGASELAAHTFLTQLQADKAAAVAAASTATTGAATATTKAGEATAAAATASAALTSFQTVYRGASASDPSDGQDGHFFYDTIAHVMKVYDSVSGTWSPAVTASIGGVRRVDYSVALGNMTGGQTVFNVPGGFTTIDVLLNGVQLLAGDDYTAATPNVTLAAGVAASDVVSVRGYLANDASEIYSKAEVNSLLSGKAAASHTQAISTITGLQTALDGKASATHNHDGTYIKAIRLGAQTEVEEWAVNVGGGKFAPAGCVVTGIRRFASGNLSSFYYRPIQVNVSGTSWVTITGL